MPANGPSDLSPCRIRTATSISAEHYHRAAADSAWPRLRYANGNRHAHRQQPRACPRVGEHHQHPGLGQGGTSGNWTDTPWTNQPPSHPNLTTNAQVDSPATVTVNSSQAAYSLELSSGGTVVVASGGTLTITGGIIINSGGQLDIESGGSLVLSGGYIIINGGTLEIANSAAMPSTGNAQRP